MPLIGNLCSLYGVHCHYLQVGISFVKGMDTASLESVIQNSLL